MIPKRGDQVVVLAEGQKFKGTVIGDSGGMLILSDIQNPNLQIFVNKNKIGALMMEGLATNPDGVEKTESESGVPDQFIVLACACDKINCAGVRYVKYGTGGSQNDFEAFMVRCKKRNPSCKRASLGKLSALPITNLKTMLDNTVFGDYPE